VEGTVYLADITIRVEETLDNERILQLNDMLCSECGILQAWIQDKARQLMMVEFDAERVQPSAIVRSMRSKGISAATATFGL
jgi:hypothetical protein